MGASTIVSHLILFIVVLGMTITLVSVLTGYVSQTGAVINLKQRSMINEIKTNIKIVSIKAENLSQNSTLKLYVKNTGYVTLKTSCLDVFIDREWVKNFTAIDPDSLELKSLWNPKETILLNVTLPKTLNESEVHEAKVVTCNGVSDSELFSK
ncbi:MAG: hypothetical protein DRO65_00110 [Candidatus Altiarchaeales archaeon]|nr:MAG: hypothetical protein DRO65_00110 [Candidatus Altiarchaeales archaeon]